MPMSAIEAMDHIVLHAAGGAHESPDDYVRVPDEAGRQVEDVLEQHGGLFRSRQHLTLFNDHYLEVSRDDGRRVLNLAYLATEPLTVREITWRWCIAGLVAGAGAGVAGIAGSTWHTVALTALSLLCLTCCAMTSRVREIHRTRTGGIAVLELSHWLWGRRASRAFARRIASRATEAARALPRGEQRLAAEMAEHRRMLMEGWLSRARYEQAKKRIFSRWCRSPAGG